MTERMMARLSVFVVVRNKIGELLLHQRANTGYLDGYYDFAASGHVEPGESIGATALRELREETGLTGRLEDLRLVHINHNYLDTPYMNFTFALDKWDGVPTITEPDKCSDLRFFAPGALPEKCTLNVRLNERTGFSDTLTYSVVTPADYEQVMGEQF